MENEKSTEYNGWKNYETWNVALWFSNDQRLYQHWLAVAKLLAGRLITNEDGDLVHKEKCWECSSAHYFAYTCFPKDNRTPDGVEVNDPAIDWDEIANAWNEDMKDYDWYAQIHEQVS